MITYEKLTNGLYTIAEMSANHSGKLEHALAIVHAAHDAGADCLKIQTFGSLTLQVDTSKFDSFDVFYRGVREAEVTDRFLYFWKHQRKTVRISRVFVLAEYKSEWGNKIIAKQFRDVLVENLKIVAPEVKLLLPLFDRFKIGGTVIGSIVCSLVKIIKTLALGLVYSFFVISAFLLLWAFKGIFGFFNSRTRCMQIFSSNLYHNSLSNNVAAVSLLVDQAETQEVKEAWLGYYMLYLHKDEAYTAEQLDAEVEKLLETSFQFKIDFEVEDAIRKLLEKGLISEIHTDGQPDRYRVLIPIQAALKRLDAIWDAIHSP